ncbi:MAG: CPBP family intramembrane metalloprotease [Micropruina sp.]|nr:MAG: CPBP family intramembrane metalloprotease [Micropruina sp.]
MLASHVVREAWLASLIRTPLLFAGAALTGLLLVLSGQPWQAYGMFSVVYFTAVNLVCWWWLGRRLLAAGRGFRDLLGRFRAADLGWALVWLTVLNVPYYLTVLGSLMLLYPGDFVRGVTEAFTPLVVIDLPGWLAWPYALFSVIVFPLLNAPIEELLYRGYAQEGFEAAGRRRTALFGTSLGFAIQHGFLAGSWRGAVAFIVAFFVWGLGAALVKRRQGRLFPLVIAHFVTNLALSTTPLLMVLGVFG